jgi:hypothetical protein
METQFLKRSDTWTKIYIDQRRIKLSIPAFPNNPHRFLMGEGFFVRPDRSQGVVYVRDSHDTAQKGNVLFSQPPGIPGTVPFFMVAGGENFRVIKKIAFFGEVFDLPDDLFPEEGVLFHLLTFLAGELSRFLKNIVADGNLSHIMKLA